MPSVTTVIEAVVAPLFHNILPAAFVDRVEVPLQLFTTVTTGIAGVVFGAAVPLPARLIQPLFEVVTVYTPAVLTIIDEVIAPVFHNKFPVAVVDNVDVPLQLFTTVTTGAEGATSGADVPLPGKLVQPSTVVVTVNVAALLVVIEGVLAPLLQCKIPVAVVESVELPQLFTTVTTGAEGAI